MTSSSQYCVCSVDTDTLLLLWMLYTFFSFHCHTKICIRYSSMETSVID